MKALTLILLLIPLTANTDRVTVAVDWRHSAELTRQCLNDGLSALVGDLEVVCFEIRRLK